MKAIVISLAKEFDNLKKPISEVLTRIACDMDLRDKVVEVYLTKDNVGEKKNFNVLSFPFPKHFPRPDLTRGESLGEIYLNPNYIKSQREDVYYMLIHGFLHLLGYDHKKNSDRIEMEKKEKELFKMISY
ncbi:MAG: rRNA maturation RNase YbeY [bacterium]|nr:rRNA maturation RNase YbeY [bacterium]